MNLNNLNKITIFTVFTFFINPIIIKPLLNSYNDQYKIDLLNVLN